ncbi:MAG: SIS domain-containing protein [Bacteroidetes bacterium]|nr:SIS domain-containing protein [Bacteroidota bacterium]
MNFSREFFNECVAAIEKIDDKDVEKLADVLSAVRAAGGRLFMAGSGGGAGHASHATCDFRKLCNIETYSVYDNVSELTARVNDEGFDVTVLNWLKVSRFGTHDCLFIFSVGGGSEKKNISPNLVRAVKYAKEVGARVVGVVGKDGGYTKEVGDAVVVIPTVNQSHVTPITEGFQAVVWHLLVSHPKLQVNAAKWESTR